LSVFSGTVGLSDTEDEEIPEEHFLVSFSFSFNFVPFRLYVKPKTILIFQKKTEMVSTL
jgi:hypothetical protein